MQEKLDQVTTCLLELWQMFSNKAKLTSLNKKVFSTPNLACPKQEFMMNCVSPIGFTQKQPTHAQNYYSTRIWKIEFPKFVGLRVKEWLHQCK